jgi:biotin synthase
MPEHSPRAETLRGAIRHDWMDGEIAAIHDLPLSDLVFQAQQVHRMHHPGEVQLSTLLSIKTGGCPEDCTCRPQSVRSPHPTPGGARC